MMVTHFLNLAGFAGINFNVPHMLHYVLTDSSLLKWLKYTCAIVSV